MTRALLVVDVQESFRQRPSWSTIDRPDIAERIDALVGAARAASDLVVWVLHAEPGSGDVFDPESGYVRVMDGLVPQPGEPVIVKTSHNAFTSTNLGQLLTQHSVRAVAVCGIKTEQCCETTARVASDLGFDVTFVVDATATTPIEHPYAAPGRSVEDVLADPRTLPAAAIVERTVYALAHRFATVRTLADVLGTPADATPA